MLKNKIFDLIGIALLVIAIVGWNYTFYSVMRLYCAIIFGIKAITYYKREEKKFFLFLFSSLLIQPFIKLHIGRTVWIFIDILLIILLIIELKTYNENN